VGTRDRILDAAAHVMRTRGFARTTTKEIAREAGYSEATLYKHFRDKSELFLDVMHERLPSFRPLVTELAQRAGQGDLRDNLAATARAAITFYEESFPMSASLFSEPDLLQAHRQAMEKRGAGPHRPVEAVAHYLRAEQKAGRVRPGADADAAAALLVGGCLQYAFLRSYSGRPSDGKAAEAYAAAIADTLTRALSV
jgi:AcrR family transcriptional regulator